MKFAYAAVLFYLMTFLSLDAQDIPDVSQIRCASNDFFAQDEIQISAFEDWMNKKRSATLQTISEKNEANEIVRIPVIFHVLHYGEEIGDGTNLSNEQILAQFEQVNNDLRKKDGTSGYSDFGADIGIELALALYDEDGHSLSQPGINRINTIEAGFGTPGTAGFSDSFVNYIIKPGTQWNPKEYLNVWIADLTSGVLGFAQFPEASGLEGIEYEGTPETDGVVLYYKSVGSTEMPNESATTIVYENYNRGRTFTHELGHWLGLRHIWGEGGCDTDDYCTDTPNTDGAHFGCPSNATSCGSPDMVENYMDYTDDICMNTFTEEQKIRIHTVLHHADRRRELLSSTKATLPESVTLGKLEVRLEDWDAVVEWTTIVENNNALFRLYKSRDGVNYFKIADIEGAGFSDAPIDYQFVDEEPFQGTNYYKLIQVDYDGTFEQIGIRSFEYYLGFQMTVHPNPTRGDVNISVWSESEGEARLRVFDASGRIQYSNTKVLQVGQNMIDLDIDEYGNGMYFIQVIQGPWQRCVKLHKL